jgi:hypothetical protein
VRTTGTLEEAITPDGIYKLVRAYSATLGFEIGAHALRATAATNSLDARPSSTLRRMSGINLVAGLELKLVAYLGN